jgi:hypothetical protein
MENEKEVIKDNQEALEKGTPQKDFFERILEASKEAEVKEEETPEVKETPKETPKEDAVLRETLTALIQEEEAEKVALEKLLPNTKDESKKLEIERAIFAKEKKIDKLKGSINPVEVVVDTKEVEDVLVSIGLESGGESYKIIEKMKAQKKGAGDLLKMYKVIATAIQSDLNKKKPEPVDLTKGVKDSTTKVLPEDNSIVGQIAKSIRN